MSAVACNVGKGPWRGCWDFDFDVANLGLSSAFGNIKSVACNSHYKARSTLGGYREKVSRRGGLVGGGILEFALVERRAALSIC